jgi:hypothetical protein
MRRHIESAAAVSFRVCLDRFQQGIDRARLDEVRIAREATLALTLR